MSCDLRAHIFEAPAVPRHAEFAFVDNLVDRCIDFVKNILVYFFLGKETIMSFVKKNTKRSLFTMILSISSSANIP